MSTTEHIAWLESEIARVAKHRYSSAWYLWKYRELVEEWTALQAMAAPSKRSA